MIKLYGARARDLLNIIEQICAAVPEVKKIWEYSSLASARDMAIGQTFQIGMGLRQAVERGEITLDNRMTSQLLV